MSFFFVFFLVEELDGEIFSDVTPLPIHQMVQDATDINVLVG